MHEFRTFRGFVPLSRGIIKPFDRTQYTILHDQRTIKTSVLPLLKLDSLMIPDDFKIDRWYWTGRWTPLGFYDPQSSQMMENLLIC